MRISGIPEENKRIIMDLDTVAKSHDCPNIIKCLGYFISESEVWLCMELMLMSLDKLLKIVQGPLPEPIIGKLVLGVSFALFCVRFSFGFLVTNYLIDIGGFEIS
jgi:mitogen-activated protein kinase kinase 7